MSQSCPEDFPGGSVVKNLPANARDARDVGSIPGLGRFPGEGHGNPLQSSCLRNSIDRGAWRGYSPWGQKELDTTEQLIRKSTTCLNHWTVLSPNWPLGYE